MAYGHYAAFTDFLLLLRVIDPAATGEWDGLPGVYRFRVATRNFQALANRPGIIVDGA